MRTRNLSLYLFVTSVVSVLALATIGAIGIRSMQRQAALTQQALTGQIEATTDSAALQMLLYQKGFAAEYLLQRDLVRLGELERSRRAFSTWLQQELAERASDATHDVLVGLSREYAAYDVRRAQLLALATQGQTAQALALLIENRPGMDRLLGLCHDFERLHRADAEAGLVRTRRALIQHIWVLLGGSLAGMLASLAVGFLLARRVARPIYDLQLKVESAVQRSRIQVHGDPAGLEALGEHLSALFRRMEETDAVLRDQRRRVIQAEKLSAIGELSAKLAHEILNPLSGMKAAVQLMCRGALPDGETVRATLGALDREIRRIEGLLRRLLSYARPLQPRVELCSVSRLFDKALEAAEPELRARAAQVARSEEPDLPTLELDPGLLTQALTNLLVNAAQATPPGRAPVSGAPFIDSAQRSGAPFIDSAQRSGAPFIELSAARVPHLGSEWLRLRVADRGPGVDPGLRARLFQPFATLRTGGHGLGLALCQNIALEHGGHIEYHDRVEVLDGPGAVFDLLLPIEPRPPAPQ